MRPFLTIAMVALSGSPVFAGCDSPKTTFMSCTFNAGQKQVSVCLKGEDVIYAFGKAGARPDLTLSTSLLDLDFTPWPGVSTPFETAVFSNGAVNYSVTAGQSYIYPEDENEDIRPRPWGDIEVIENGETIATLICDEGSTVYNWDSKVGDAKRAIGQCWDFDTRQWRACK